MSGSVVEHSWLHSSLEVGDSSSLFEGELTEVHRSGSLHLDLIGVVVSPGSVVSGSLRLVLLLALEFGVLDIRAVTVDMTLLVAGSQLLLAVSDQEDVLISWRGLDIVGELLDLLLSELVEEVDNQPSWHLVDLDP